MEFGILFTSHPNHATEPYPHRDVHARVTAEIQAADAHGYDTAWVAEHHFSNEYGIMPDVFTYLGYLAARTSRIRLGTAVVTVPLYDPIRVVENMAFVDNLSNGRMVLGLGSGYRPYEFEGFGRDFDSRRDMQEEAIGLILELLHRRRAAHKGTYFRSTIEGAYEIFPVSVQEPHPPLFMAAGTERSMAYAARHGFGLMLSTLPSFETLARQIAFYRGQCPEAPAHLARNPAHGNVDVARWVYVAESDAEARRDSADDTWRFWGTSAVFFAGSVATQMLLVHQVAYLVDHGVPALVGATLVGVVGISSIVGKAGWGALSDRFGRELTFTLAFACVAASVGFLALAGVYPRSLLPYSYAVLIGVGYAVTAPLTPAIASDLFGARASRASSGSCR